MKHFALSVVAMFLASTALASPKRTQDVAIQGEPWTGGYAVEETVSHIMQRQMREAHQVSLREERDHPHRPSGLPLNPDSPFTGQWPPVPADEQPIASPTPLFSIGAHWNAVDFLNAGHFVPPDNMLSVGPTQVVVDINDHIRVFSKAGALGALDADTDTFFANLLPSGFEVTDPEVRFDPLTNRWFIVCIDFNPSNEISANDVLLAISSGPTITDSTSFRFFAFTPQNVGTTPNVDTGLLGDRPSFGLDNKALYIGLNMVGQNSGPQTTSLYVVRKSSVLSTGPIVVTPFRSLIVPIRRACTTLAGSTTSIRVRRWGTSSRSTGRVWEHWCSARSAIPEALLRCRRCSSLRCPPLLHPFRPRHSVRLLPWIPMTTASGTLASKSIA